MLWQLEQEILTLYYLSFSQSSIMYLVLRTVSIDYIINIFSQDKYFTQLVAYTSSNLLFCRLFLQVKKLITYYYLYNKNKNILFYDYLQKASCTNKPKFLSLQVDTNRSLQWRRFTEKKKIFIYI